MTSAHDLIRMPEPLVFSGATLDRAQALRATPERVTELLEAPGAAVVGATADGVLVALDDPTRVVRLPLSEADEYIDSEALILLGLDDAAPIFAVDLDPWPDAEPPLPDGTRVMPLREAGAALPRAEAGLSAYAVALLNWHRRHSYCANCGTLTAVVEGGLSRKCPNCGASHFPRTDPVVIMLVEHDDQLLLGRRSGWPADRYSTLAGFVSSGETPEEAVVREVKEESGIVAYDPIYLAAQPWPFPASLMLGYAARSDGGTPVATDGELEDVRWFTRAEVKDAVDWDSDIAGRPKPLRLPPGVSIARSMIDAWLASGGRA
jgi:NAD+ diphosphatase